MFDEIRDQVVLLDQIGLLNGWAAKKYGGVIMDVIFDLCVVILVTLAERFGMTYQEVNVWIFVIVWPILTLILLGLILRQHLLIKQLRRDHLVRERLNPAVYEK